MAQIGKVQRCYHCGVILQTEDKNAPGFIDKEIMDASPEGFLLCNNCYKTERFQNSIQEATFDDEYRTIMREIKEKNALVIYIVDLFSFEGAMVTKLMSLLNGIDVIAVGNKRDLLPKDADDIHLSEYVSHHLRQNKLKVIDTVIVSSTTEYNIQTLISLLIKHAKNRDIYVLGASISGKTALIEDLLKHYSNNTNKMIMTYPFKGTSLSGLRIPVNKNHYIFETPGTSADNSLISKVEKQVQNAIVPKRELTPKTFNLAKNHSIIIGGLACIEIISNEKTTVELYCSDRIEVERHRHHAYKRMEDNINKGKLFPQSAKFDSMKDFDIYDIKVTEVGRRDIGILGLGWITFEGNNQEFRIYIPKGVYVYSSRSKIKNAK